jgi:hypothetical protein
MASFAWIVRAGEKKRVARAGGEPKNGLLA